MAQFPTKKGRWNCLLMSPHNDQKLAKKSAIIWRIVLFAFDSYTNSSYNQGMK